MLVRFLRICIILLCGNTFVSTADISTDIVADATISEDNIFLIFRHPRKLNLNPSFLGMNGRVRSDSTINMTISNNLVNSICKSLSVSDLDNKIINFRLDSKYKFLNVIYGEKLVAFKLNNPDFVKSKEPEIEDTKIQDDKDIKSNDITIKSSSKNTQIANILVQYTENKKGGAQLLFPFAEKNVGAAVFKRGNDVWIVFDTRKDFYISDRGSNIDSWSQYPDINNTIIKLHINKNLEVQTEKNANNWAIKFIPSSSKKKLRTSLKAESQNDNLVLITPVSGVNNIVTVRDKDIGDLIAIVPIANVDCGVMQDRKMLDYNILESAQGIAISLLSEDIKVLYNNKESAIEIASRYKVPDTTKHSASEADIKSILPILAQKITGAEFMNVKNTLTGAIVSAVDDDTKSSALINLAQFYFANGMYHESAGALCLAEKFSQKQTKALLPKLMKAVSLVMMGDNLDARSIFTHLQTHYKDSANMYEISLWNKYNEYKLGSNPEKIVEDYDNKLLASYPDEIYWNFLLSELNLATDKKNFKLIDSLLPSLRKSDNLYINNNIKYYKAQYYYIQNQHNLAEQLLNDITSHPSDGRDYMMAQLQIIKMQYESRRLDWLAAVHELNQLRYVWRGDKLEMKLLTSLALAYEQNGDVINSIRTYKYILDAFGKQEDSSFFVTSQIVDLYRRIFLSHEFDNLDDFVVIALFYEFKEFTPIGAEGDQAVLSIARRMINLDLLDMAESILEHQVDYRLRGPDRTVTANHLALVLLMDHKPEMALATLESTDKENTNFIEYERRKYLKVKALIDLKKYKEALHYILDDNSENATALRLEIYFRSHKWSDYISLMEPVLKQKMSEGDVIKGEQSQDVLRLAVSYSMLNRTADLVYLNEHLMTENKNLKSVIEFLKDTNTPINPHNVDKSLNIDKMQHFIEDYKDLLFK